MQNNLLARALVGVFAALLLTASPSFAETVTVKLTNHVYSFPNVKNLWGTENLVFSPATDDESASMRVHVPKGAIDPGTMMRRGLPRGGAGFKSHAFPDGVERAILSYRVRFPLGFNFMRGGKLPGLCGGVCNSGGKIPNGSDGFSMRLMWGLGGRGSVYAYLPTSVTWGSGLLVHKLHFTPGRWHSLTQEVILNDPGVANGIVRMWQDGVYLGEETDVLIRKSASLKINGMFFDVFFGGNDDSWAPPADTHIDFADFVIRSVADVSAPSDVPEETSLPSSAPGSSSDPSSSATTSPSTSTSSSSTPSSASPSTSSSTATGGRSAAPGSSTSSSSSSKSSTGSASTGSGGAGERSAPRVKPAGY